MSAAVDLFGNVIQDKLPGGAMCQRFIEPPFSTLDARTGRWQDRKRDWISLGIESEVGREVSGRNCTSGSGSAMLESSNSRLRANTCSSTNAMKYAGGYEDSAPGTATVSIFDPVICELVYTWFMPFKPSMGILNPFAGGSVRGIVASRLGYQYNGIELRREQIDANVRQAIDIPCEPKPHWICGDSRNVESLVGDEYDLLFTCPPYWNLERYSDDQKDLSTCETWGVFAQRYSEILAKSAKRLKSQRFAVVVVGNIRDADGFIRDMRPVTHAAMADAGFKHYNDFVLLTSIGSLPLRVNGQFSKGRKAGSAHQYVLCYFRGNPESIRYDFDELAGV